jgi:hypothetical protein
VYYLGVFEMFDGQRGDSALGCPVERSSIDFHSAGKTESHRPNKKLILMALDHSTDCRLAEAPNPRRNNHE